MYKKYLFVISIILFTVTLFGCSHPVCIKDFVTYKTIEYELDGGENNPLNKTECIASDGILTLYDPIKNGYAFKGWYYDNDYTEIVSKINCKELKGNLTLYAKWEEETYTITYVLYGGTNNKDNPTHYTVTTPSILLKSPTTTQEDCYFDGWYSDTAYTTRVDSIPEGSFGNLVLYAKWQENIYTITYILNGGTNNSSNPSSYTVSSGIISLNSPSRRGYNFDGWYSDSEFTTRLYKIESSNKQNVVVYAKWSVITYTITYVLNGGSNSSSNPTSYTVESNITLSNPTLTGSTFQGWYTDSNFTNKITSINGQTGNLKLYAKWQYLLTITSIETYIGPYINVTINFIANKYYYNIAHVWTTEGGCSPDSISIRGSGSQSRTIRWLTKSSYFQKGKTYTLWIADSTTNGNENVMSNKYTFTIPNK